MKKYGLAVFPLILLVMILSCTSDFYEYNLFEGLDPASPLPGVSELESLGDVEALNLLKEEVYSESFIEQLSAPENIEQKEEILTYLKDKIVDEAGAITAPAIEATEEEINNFQQTAVLYAQVSVATTGGDEFANNVFGLIGTLMGGGEEDPAEETPTPVPGAPTPTPGGPTPTPAEEEGMFGTAQIEEIVETLLPKDTDTEDEFRLLVEGLLDAGEAYEAIGDTITDSNEDDVIGTEDAPEDIIMGEIAQNALSAALVTVIIDVLDDPEDETDDPIAELYDWVVEGNEPTIEETALQDTMMSLLGIDPGEDPGTEDPTVGEDYDGLQNVLYSAGFGPLLESLTGGGEEPEDHIPTE